MSEQVVNPLLEYRLAQNWSLDRISREIGVSPSTVIRTEQGCYGDIPPAILRFISSYFLSPNAVRDQYLRYQTSKRSTIRDHNYMVREFSRSLKSSCNADWTINPFLVFREEILRYKSRLAFCKDYCLHPSTVKRIEDGIAEEIPVSIISALEEVHLNSTSILTLINLYNSWRHPANVAV